MPKPISLPFRPRDPMPINSAFGKRPLYGDFHSGIDFNSTTGVVLNTPIPAAGPGTVIESYNGNSPGQTNWAQLRGTMVVIDHGDGWKTRYHMLVPNSNIANGRKVDIGDIIGRVGSSGKSTTGPHLHFELWKDGKAIDPLSQLTYKPAELAGLEPTPIDNTEDIEMIRIKSPNRTHALIGPGYYRPLTNAEEVQLSGSLMAKHIDGNDRQYDVWVSLALTGSAAATEPSNSDKAILAALKTSAPQVNVDYAKLAEQIVNLLPERAAATKEDVVDALQNVTFKAV